MFGIMFPGLSQVSRPSMSVPNVWSEHPPTKLPVSGELESWRTEEPSEVVAGPGFGLVQSQLGLHITHKQTLCDS